MFTCQYELTSKPIGEGAFGVVSIVERKGKKYVLKKLISEKDEESYFQNPVELDILFRLNSPHILKGYDITIAGECDKKDVGVVTEYINGDTFKDKKKLSFSEKKKLMFDFAKGLKCMHDNKYLHLDIKLENAMYQKENGVKGVLIDYGLSAYCKNGVKNGVELNSKIGTFYYASPKIATTDDSNCYTDKDDIWALGLLYCELFADIDDIYFDLGKITAGDSPSDYKKLVKYFRYYMSNKNIEQYLDDIIFYKQKVPSSIKSLIKRMLVFEENDRCHINEVIQHPFFNELYSSSRDCYIEPEQMMNLQGLSSQDFENIYNIIRVAKEQMSKADPIVVFMAIDIYLRFMILAGYDVSSKVRFPEIIALIIAHKYFNWGSGYRLFDDSYLEIVKEENLMYKIINGRIRCERYYSNCKYIEDVKFIVDKFIMRTPEKFNSNLYDYLNYDGKSLIEQSRVSDELTPIKDLTVEMIF
jgi:serine/threonine protein kinase